MEKSGFIVTVGTNLLKNYVKWLGNSGSNDIEEDLKQMNDKNLNKDYIDFIKSNLSRPDSVSYPSAELQTLGLFFKEGVNHGLRAGRKHISLIPVKGAVSLSCAIFIKDLLLDINFAAPLIGGIPQIDIKDPIEINFDNQGRFASQVGALVAQISDVSELYTDKGCSRIVVCISAGYKALIPYISVLGFINGLEIIYAHLTSTSVVAINSVPLSWDMRTLDEHRIWFVNDDIPSAIYYGFPAMYSSYRAYYDETPVEKDGELFFQKSAFGKLISQAYKLNRQSRFGWGQSILSYFPSEDKQLKEDIKKLITGRWQHLWIGDQIPETVEHNRGHSCRLIELTRELMSLTNLFFSGPELYCLIAAIWLHDVGHTAIKTELIKSADGYYFPLHLFPSLVRELHHILSCDYILSENELKPDMINAISTICKFHRSKMPLSGNKENYIHEPFNIEVEPLQNYYESQQELSLERVKLLTAILRFLDGCDVQADRVIDNDYMQARQKRTNTEIDVYTNRLQMLINGLQDKKKKEEMSSMMSCLQVFLDNWNEDFKRQRKDLRAKIQEEAYHSFTSKANPCFLEILGLMDSILFKREQEEHFKKHVSIECVYLGGAVFHEYDSMNKKDVPAIGVYILVKKQTSSDSPLTPQLQSVAQDIWDEYEAVQEILEEYFTLAGIYIYNGESIVKAPIVKQVQP